MTAESQSSAEVGRRLFISPRTVEAHRQNAMRKLGLRNQGDVVHYALKKAFHRQLNGCGISARRIVRKNAQAKHYTRVYKWVTFRVRSHGDPYRLSLLSPKA
jgi:Bacterial regulatory proteins, luxR family